VKVSRPAGKELPIRLLQVVIMIEEQAIQGSDEGQHEMVIQSGTDQELTRETSDRPFDEQQEEEPEDEREENWMFPEDDDMLIRRAEIENYEEEEKEVLRKLMNEIRQNPEKSPPNLRYSDRKKVKAATMKVNKVLAIIRTVNNRNKHSIACSWKCCIGVGGV